jgi:uncharacterized membrane protein YgaE (UPF0421/DUF939 family)
VLLAARLTVGLALLWAMRGFLSDDPSWAFISLIVVGTEPAGGSWKASVGRFTNTLVGCVIGLGALWCLPLGPGALAVGVALTVLVCSAFLGAPTSWKLAPITTTIVMSQAILQGSRAVGVESGARRVFQVLVGSSLAVMLTIAFSKLERAWTRTRAKSPAADTADSGGE